MAKAKLRQNKDREERITMEIIVDAYGPEEQAKGRTEDEARPVSKDHGD